MEHSFDQEYWDRHWRDRQTGGEAVADQAGPPNPHLVREVEGLVPGTALDTGCGVGGEALWLASRGWQVTGADIAAGALASASESAAARGLAEKVRWVQADLSVWEPATPYDLVTTHYAHPTMPQLEFYDRVASWVAPGGTLLIVGHLHRGGGQSHGHDHCHGHEHGEPAAAASVTAARIVERLDPADWEIVTATESSRTVARHGGAEVVLHDAVVRAIRRDSGAVPTDRG